MVENNDLILKKQLLISEWIDKVDAIVSESSVDRLNIKEKMKDYLNSINSTISEIELPIFGEEEEK